MPFSGKLFCVFDLTSNYFELTPSLHTLSRHLKNSTRDPRTFRIDASTLNTKTHYTRRYAIERVAQQCVQGTTERISCRLEVTIPNSYPQLMKLVAGIIHGTLWLQSRQRRRHTAIVLLLNLTPYIKRHRASLVSMEVDDLIHYLEYERTGTTQAKMEFISTLRNRADQS